ncbi:hypothetical protein [Mycolicibacterium senegalense]|uniref:Uncharacterized protein n=1 Tax=Mycolicibacterium senegalense TaxID=1796 RepID=A0ABR5G1Q2_9MYCO|nr:hypothetical protein [Mycolicibacterium senegalense]KLI05807.1 hypothetical protein AA982_22935 [Mycolicibacterium senegalense]KLO54091.1 hypothetical protein ABW05_24105 [Mycolicibacterium senegalense]KLO54158.1 hypothetical protein ABW05_24535 [Mycolicibacterium senegalense]
MKRVDLADLGGADLGTVMRDQAEAQAAVAAAKSEVYVYVLEVTFFGEYGWTSVHRSIEGAKARLFEKVDEYDVREQFAGMANVVGDESVAAGEEGDVVVWGISKLPVEQ